MTFSLLTSITHQLTNRLLGTRNIIISDYLLDYSIGRMT
jgi:hypothetical protein